MHKSWQFLNLPSVDANQVTDAPNPIPKTTNNRRVPQETYRLPNSQTFEVAGTTALTLISPNTQVSSMITTANLCQDFAASSNARQVVFKRATFEISPVTDNNTFGYQSPPGVQTVQVYAIDVNAGRVQLMAQKALSKTNVTRFTVNIPIWLSGPVAVNASINILEVQFMSNPMPIPSSPIFFGYTVKAVADISRDTPNFF